MEDLHLAGSDMYSYILALAKVLDQSCSPESKLVTWNRVESPLNELFVLEKLGFPRKLQRRACGMRDQLIGHLRDPDCPSLRRTKRSLYDSIVHRTNKSSANRRNAKLLGGKAGSIAGVMRVQVARQILSLAGQ